MSDITNARINWLDNGSPFSEQFSDIYFSAQGGLAESGHVFLDGNELARRWSAAHAGDFLFTLVELGFGTGLNFLLSWRLFEQQATGGRRLHYLAFEKHPLTQADLQRALQQWPELADHSNALLDVYVDHSGGLHRYSLSDTVTLDLYFGDALSGMRQTLPACPSTVDCWFMDGFAPARNPALWGEELIELMWHHSRPGATVATYSVAGQVRRQLASAGFQLERRPGFGNKREMLVAHKPTSVVAADPVASDRRPAWFRTGTPRFQHRHATVIGAGLAGCSTAYSLARKGWHVTLIETNDRVADAASGNPQAVLQPRLAASHNAQARFYLHAVLFAHRQFNGLQQHFDIGWHPDGVLRLAGQDRAALRKLAVNPGTYYSDRFLRPLSASQAGELAGLPLEDAALWLPYGGWLRPVSLCRTYLDAIPDEQLTLLTGRPVSALQQQGSSWQVESATGPLGQSEVVVIASSYQAGGLAQSAFLPLLPVAGQLTRVAATTHSERLRRVIVADRYLCPADGGTHCVGASYHRNAVSVEDPDAANRENLAGINTALPGLNLTDACGSRASVRCNAGDYFPIVGPLPDYQDFLRVFAPLARDASHPCQEPARYQPGLYINVAHGSYGLASAPLSGELIASQINGELLPVETRLADALNPARFIIRDLKKQLIEPAHQGHSEYRT